jgi:hypothetical protein
VQLTEAGFASMSRVVASGAAQAASGSNVRTIQRIIFSVQGQAQGAKAVGLDQGRVGAQY